MLRDPVTPRTKRVYRHRALHFHAEQSDLRDFERELDQIAAEGYRVIAVQTTGVGVLNIFVKIEEVPENG